MFPKLPGSAVLRSELSWKISAKEAVKFDAELVFISAGLNWEANYNAITAGDGTIRELTGWITVKNNLSAHFENAKVKVVGGEVNRAGETQAVEGYSAEPRERHMVEPPPAPELRTFDEYHEYLLPRPVTLSEGETSQVEFIRAHDVGAKRSFIYDGSLGNVDSRGINSAILDPQWSTQSSKTVAIVYEFKNAAAHHLGIPLPAGRIHFYGSDQDGQLQFAGDAGLDNTASNEMIRLSTGSAFDLAGERKQTNFQINQSQHTATETFEIRLRNHRKEKTEIRVQEHPARWREWEITAHSLPFEKLNQRTIEFRLPIGAEEEKTITYSIRYAHLPAARRAE